MKKKIFIVLALLIAFVVGGFAAVCEDAFALECQITLDDTNNLPANVSGYHIYKATSTGGYDWAVPCDVNGVTLVPVGTTSVTLTGLSDTEDHFITVKVVGANGRESNAAGELNSVRPQPLKSLTGSWIE